MSLKTISFPLFLVVLIFVALNFIRPTILSILDKNDAKVLKETELKTVQATLANIGTLAESRAGILAGDKGRLAIEYLPYASDQDRVIDILNYLSIQAGASISSIAFEESKAPPRPETPVQAEPLADGSVPPAPPVAPLPRTFSAEVSMTGTYDSLKSFMEKVTNANRMHAVSSFSIVEKKESAAPEGEPAPAADGFLDATFAVEFSYLPEEAYANAYLHPVFAAGNFDVVALEDLSKVKSDVPALVEPSVSGRSNPFIP